MTPEDRALLQTVSASVRTALKAQQRMSGMLTQLALQNGVLSAACAALYAELARVSGRGEDELTEMLARLTGTTQGSDKPSDPTYKAHVLQAVEMIQAGAEAMMSDFRG